MNDKKIANVSFHIVGVAFQEFVMKTSVFKRKNIQ
ncbi:hypothetical protein RUMTOR_01506 [[Ruminococcus] torques ATCC 27756]|uniref:Uncharacterized protein n=1 Tax=[Ruminococcus] torques ATCC 27756 TaxID=411460 RepID=A5KMN3_9FIRM|nr:hypothetical protein RUMTOR_01506 [[Ruminococcus] torques ATCC 27756]